MELWTGVLSSWKCHWPDLKSAGFFQQNVFLNSLKTSTLTVVVNQLWSIDFLTPSTPLIIPHRLPAFLESLMPLKKLMLVSCKMLQKQCKAFHIFLWHFFPSLKHNFIACHSSKLSSCPDCIFEIHQLWQSVFSDVLLWTPSHGRAKAGHPTGTYIPQLCADMGCSPKDLPKAMNDREVWWERVRNICTDSTTWWWKSHGEFS